MESPRKTGVPIAMLVTLLALAGTGCAGTLTGQVLDAQTGQPVAGAVVLGVWTKAAGLPGLAHTELVAVRETETDAQGRFALEAPAPFSADEQSVTVYRFAYTAWNNLFVFPTSARRPGDGVPPEILLERFPASESRRRHLDFINDARRSVLYDSSTVPRFWNAIRREIQLR